MKFMIFAYFIFLYIQIVFTLNEINNPLTLKPEIPTFSSSYPNHNPSKHFINISQHSISSKPNRRKEKLTHELLQIKYW